MSETRALLSDAACIRQQKGLDGPVELHTPYAWGSSLPSNLALADLTAGFQVVLDAPIPEDAQLLSLPDDLQALVFEKGDPQPGRARVTLGDAAHDYERLPHMPNWAAPERRRREAQVYNLLRQVQTRQGDELPVSAYTQVGGDYARVTDDRRGGGARIEPVYGRMHFQRGGKGLGGPAVVVAERLREANPDASAAPEPGETTWTLPFEELSGDNWYPQGNLPLPAIFDGGR